MTQKLQHAGLSDKTCLTEVVPKFGKAEREYQKYCGSHSWGLCLILQMYRPSC